MLVRVFLIEKKYEQTFFISTNHYVYFLLKLKCRYHIKFILQANRDNSFLSGINYKNYLLKKKKSVTVTIINN